MFSEGSKGNVGKKRINTLKTNAAIKKKLTGFYMMGEQIN